MYFSVFTKYSPSPEYKLEKMFFLFPDPHFKKKKHKSRVISSPLLTQYAYFLKENASLYISTDVYDLFIWMRRCLDNHPLFEEFSGEEFNSDVCKRLLYKGTEESEKAKHRNAQVYAAAYHRVSSFNNPQCKSWVKLYEPDIDDCDSCPSD